jgi:anti-repressor protein
MNELIKVNTDGDRPTVSARLLHEFLGVKEKYTDWFKRMVGYGFTENVDFALVSEKTETNNPKNPYTVLTNHQLTIDMAKELCMIQRTERGKQARQYFLEVERKWNSPQAIVARALQITSKQLEEAKGQVSDLQVENKKLLDQAEADRPKVLFAYSVQASKTSVLVRELAKILHQNGIDIGEKRLFTWLRENGYLIKQKGSDYNMPTQRSMELKIFEIKESTVNTPDGKTLITRTPKVTGKGQVYFVNKFKEAIS